MKGVTIMKNYSYLVSTGRSWNASLTGMILFLIIFLFSGKILSQTSESCVYGWTLQTSGTASQLFTVHTVSATVGWAGGANGTIRRTTDGTSWTSANTGTLITGDVRSICGLDENTALCTTSPSESNIYRTSNGGMNWTRVYTLNESAIYSIRMVSATEGYALGAPKPVGDKWMILKTVDGGMTWNRMATEPMAASPLEAGFRNSFQIMGSHMWFGTNNERVYHSTDLGATWTSGATPGLRNTYCVYFNSPDVGIAGGDDPASNFLALSVNGGQNYNFITPPGPGGTVNGIAGNGTDFWLIRSSLDIYRSSNNGSSWTPVFSQNVGIFQDINFKMVDGCPQGWAVGNGGVIAKLTSLTGISGNSTIPETYSLGQNFPNPFNPSTNISFSLPEASMVSLKIFDISGKEVSTLINEQRSAGSYIAAFNASELPSGTYFYRLEAGRFTDTRKMMVVK